MWRLAVLTSAMAGFETLFFSALAPLLPSFKDELGISKAQAGLLVAAYAIGLAVAALPVGLLASRIGVKQSALVGLSVLALASVSFGIVDNYAGLLGTRLVQGAAGALCWAGGLSWLVEATPRERRSTMIGLFVGAGSAGQVVGPAIGGLAELAGRRGVFVGLAAVAMLLVLLGARHRGPASPDPQPWAVIRAAHASRAILGSQLLVALPGLLLGTLGVLGPLRLSALGWGPEGIAGTFLVAAAFGVLSRPLIGRWADRRGRLETTSVLLVPAIPIALLIPWLDNSWALACSIVVAVSIFGGLWAPVMAHVSGVYEERGLTQAFGFAVVNLSAGAGIVIGSAGGGEVAHLAGDVTAYGVLAGVCLVALGVLRVQQRRPAATPA